MWNFGYPYKLKQLIDLVAQRNLLFTYDETCTALYSRLLGALVIFTRGGGYDEDSPDPRLPL